MRKINNIVIHCSAGFANAKATQKWFLSPIEDGGKGWDTGGYNIIIDLDGTINQIYDFNKITNGVYGYNSNTIHICYVGGVENVGTSKEPKWKGKDTRTSEQKESLHKAIKMALDWCKKNGNESIGVVGHRDYSPDINNDGVIQSWERIKECPSFDAILEYSCYYATEDRVGKLPTVK